MCSLECKRIHLERVHQQQKIENGEILVASCDGDCRTANSRNRCHVSELESECVLSVLYVEWPLHKHGCTSAFALERRLLRYKEACISQFVENSTTPVSAALFGES